MFVQKALLVFLSIVPTFGSSSVRSAERVKSRALQAHLHTPAEHAALLHGSNFESELTLVRDGLVPHGIDATSFSYELAGLVIGGYILSISSNVPGITRRCRIRGGIASNGTIVCVQDCMGVAGKFLIGTALLSGGNKAIALVQDYFSIENHYDTSNSDSTEEFITAMIADHDSENHDSEKRDLEIQARSQPCPNRNSAVDFGQFHCHFPESKSGFKISCKGACGLEPSASQLPYIEGLIIEASKYMLEHNALNMQFTIYEKGSGEVMSRCSAQLETVQSNTCAVPITGNGCKF